MDLNVLEISTNIRVEDNTAQAKDIANVNNSAQRLDVAEQDPMHDPKLIAQMQHNREKI